MMNATPEKDERGGLLQALTVLRFGVSPAVPSGLVHRILNFLRTDEQQRRQRRWYLCPAAAPPPSLRPGDAVFVKPKSAREWDQARGTVEALESATHVLVRPLQAPVGAKAKRVRLSRCLRCFDDADGPVVLLTRDTDTFRTLANSQPRAGCRVVEIGASYGECTSRLARAVGPEGSVIGLDCSAEALAEARTRLEPGISSGVVELRVMDCISDKTTFLALARDATLVFIDVRPPSPLLPPSAPISRCHAPPSPIHRLTCVSAPCPDCADRWQQSGLDGEPSTGIGAGPDRSSRGGGKERGNGR